MGVSPLQVRERALERAYWTMELVSPSDREVEWLKALARVIEATRAPGK